MKFNPFTGKLDFEGDGGSSSGSSSEILISKTIPALTLDESDLNLATTFRGIIYNVFAATQDGTKFKTLTCFVSKDGTTAVDQVAHKLGVLRISIQNDIAIGYHKLKIENFETQPIILTIQKYIF